MSEGGSTDEFSERQATDELALESLTEGKPPVTKPWLRTRLKPNIPPANVFTKEERNKIIKDLKSKTERAIRNETPSLQSLAADKENPNNA